MQRVFLLLSLFFVTHTAIAQDFNYRKYITKGIRFYNEQEYYQALTEFNAARSLRGVPTDSLLVIDDWIELCAIGLRKQKAQATDALSLAEAKEMESTIRARQAQALYLATMANETFQTDPTLALRIAEQAFKLDSTHHLVQKTLTDIYYKAQNDNLLLYRKKFIGHNSPVMKIKFSPDQKYLLSLDWTSDILMWNTEGRLLNTIVGHKGHITDLNFSPNGKYFATSSLDSLAIIWESDGTPSRILKKHKGGIAKCAWSPNSDMLVTAGADSLALLWNLNGEVLATMKGHNAPLTSISFSPDGTSIITSAVDSSVILWNLQGKLIKRIRTNVMNIQNAIFTPNGKNIMILQLDTAVRFYDLSGKMVLKIDNPNKDIIGNVVISPDGNRLITVPLGNMYDYEPASQDLFIYDFKGNIKTVIKQIPGQITDAVFSGSGEYIAAASSDSMSRVYARDGSLVGTMKGHSGFVSSLAFAPDGQSVYSGGNDFAIYEWRLQSIKKLISKAQSSSNNISIISHDAKYLILANDYYQIEVVNTNGDTEAHLNGHQDYISSITYSPTGHYILTTSYDRTARLYNTTGVEKAVLMGHSYSILYGCFSDNEKMLLTCSDDSTARIWDTNGKLLAVYPEHRESVLYGCFSPDNSKVLTVSGVQQTRVWNTKGKTLFTLEGNIGYVSGAEFSPDGSLILTHSTDDILIWDDSGNLLTRIEIPNSGLAKAHFSPDGNRIFAIFNGSNPTVYDIQGRPLYNFTDKENSISNGLYSKNGAFIITYGDYGSVKLWDKKGLLLSSYDNATDFSWIGASINNDASRVLAVNFGNYIYQWLTPMGIFKRLQKDSSIYVLNILEKENLSIKLDTNDLKMTLNNHVHSVEAIDLYLRKAADNPELAEVYFEKTDWLANELKKSNMQLEMIKRLYNISEIYGKNYGIDIMLQLYDPRHIYNSIRHIRTKISRQSDGRLGLTKLTIKQNLRFAKQCTQLAELLLKKTYFTHDSISSFAARQYATLAWYQVRNGDFQETLTSSKRGLAINDSTEVINTNIAHALLLSGKFNEAAKIYTSMKGNWYSDTETYRKIFLEDFDILRLDLRNEKYNALMDSMAKTYLYNAIDSVVRLGMDIPYEQFFNNNDTSELMEYWYFWHDSAISSIYYGDLFIKNLNLAAQLYKKARPFEPNNEIAGQLNDYAYQYLLIGDGNTALQILQTALLYAPDLPILYTNFPPAYLLSGQVNRAKQMYLDFKNQPYRDGKYREVFIEDLQNINSVYSEIPEYDNILKMLKQP